MRRGLRRLRGASLPAAASAHTDAAGAGVSLAGRRHDQVTLRPRRRRGIRGSTSGSCAPSTFAPPPKGVVMRLASCAVTRATATSSWSATATVLDALRAPFATAVHVRRARVAGGAHRSRGLHGPLHRHAPALRASLPRHSDRSLPPHRRLICPAAGRLAQLGEHQLDKLGVTGSRPVPPIADRNPACFRRP